MARTNLTDEEAHPHNWMARGMIVQTDQVQHIYSQTEGEMIYEPTGREWFEYRSTTPDPNGSKYLGVPLLPPPSLSTYDIYQMLRVCFPNVKAEYYDSYKQDQAMQGRPQIIWSGYQFLTPRDSEMIAAGFFTTLSFHNKVISRLETNKEYAARRQSERELMEREDDESS